MKEAKFSDSILQPIVRCCLPTGAFVGVLVEVLSAFHVLGRVISADCVTASILSKWSQEFGVLFMTNAAVACLASIAHGLLYDEFLNRGWKTDLSFDPEKRHSVSLKKIYLVTLIPLLLIVGYFSASILMTEFLHRPGAVNFGC